MRRGSVRAFARTLPLTPAMLLNHRGARPLLECVAALTVLFDPEP